MDTFHNVKQTIVDAAVGAGETIADVARGARDAVVDAKDAVVDVAKDAKDKTLDMAHDAKQLVQKIAHTVTGLEHDILVVLKNDHEVVNGLFEQLEATSRNSRMMREGLYGQLKYELDVHSTVEELLFYPALRKARGSSLPLAEAYAEHDLVKQLLIDLATQPVDGEDWIAQLRVLRENVQRHVQEEEDELFTLAAQCMSSTQREALGLRFQAEKERLDVSPKPRHSHTRGHKLYH